MALVDAFYQWLDQFEWKDRFLAPEQAARVREGQIRYWRSFLAGVLDEDYINLRLQVGAFHAQVGLPVPVHAAAMNFCAQWLQRAVASSDLPNDAKFATNAAVTKLCQLDIALVTDAYSTHHAFRLEGQAQDSAAILAEVTKVATAASLGHFDVIYESKGSDAQLAHAMNRMIEGFKETVAHANAVAHGDLSSAQESPPEGDELRFALFEMTRALREARASVDSKDWFRRGHSQLNDLMRGQDDVDELSSAALQHIAKFVGAHSGILYVAESEDELRLASIYAGPSASSLQPRIALGEGLLGQAVRERRAQFNVDLGEHAISFSHGMGTIELRYCSVLPLAHSSGVVGVLQLATVKPLDHMRLEIMAQVAEPIAISLGTALSRLRMQGVLDRSNRQAEQLEQQSEAMLKTNRELSSQRDELARSQGALEAQQSELRRSNEELAQKSTQAETRRKEVERKNSEIETIRQNLQQRAEELELSNKYKTEFLANMSHELRTPLNSLLILAENLAENEEGNLDEDQIESARIIHCAGNELLELINEVLDLAKIEAGKMQLRVEDVGMMAFLHQLREQFNAIAKSNRLDFIVDVQAGLPAAIHTDPVRTRQVLRNLLANAFKFTDTGTVTLCVDAATNSQGEPCVRFAVTDTGPGIPPTARAAIFEAFHQEDGSATRQHGGTGLGLTIARKLTEMLGGSMNVESEVGRGSTFTLQIPLVAVGSTPLDAVVLTVHAPRPRPLPPAASPAVVVATPSIAPTTPAPAQPLAGPPTTRSPAAVAVPPAANRAPAPPLNKLGGISILLIEDNKDLAKAVANVIRKRGFRPFIASNGEEGLTMALELQPGGIVLDLGLPDLDGSEVLTRLAQDPSTAKIPVHIMTGKQVDARDFDAQVIGLAHKPIAPEDISQMLAAFAPGGIDVNRVLLVEDDATHRALVANLLRRQGLLVEEADSGSAALDMVSAQVFDCIVLDLGLPDISGYDVLSRLRANSDSPSVIAYTGRQLEDEEIKQLELDTETIVIKGVGSTARLLDEVCAFLHRRVVTDDETAAPKRAPITQLMGQRVLIVDDDPRNIFALSRALKGQSMEVDTATNGQEALDRIAQQRPDIVIMDIMMPLMDGYEAMEKIRKNPEFAQLPVIALTARAMPEDGARCIAAGATEYLSKPVAADHLIALARILLCPAAA